MIKISENKDKRADICRIDFVYISRASILDYPGSYIYIKTYDWISIKYSSATFQESDEVNGEPINQELNIKIFGSNEETNKLIRDVCGKPILLRIYYSNQDEKIIGTEDNPVVLSHTSSGSPLSQTLSSKRNSAEKAKYLKSF